MRTSEERFRTAEELLETASNLLHAPLAFLRGTPAHDPHKAATEKWMEKYEALINEEFEDEE